MGNSNAKPVVLTDEVNLNHFRLLRVVGKGAFGKVRIVERKDTGLSFALKYIRKDEVVRSDSVRNIVRERNMLEHLNHPFLCNLRYTFQDMEYMYIVVDLMNGGDLRFHISRKTFTEEAVRFWIAELGCALRYVHRQGIVHRDVKPDNILLDSEGHVHLGDFNVATNIIPGKPSTSKSGTLAYLAPEVYSGRGYYSECDWWSLGVTFYECIYNKRPFVASHSDELSQQIMKAEPPFPNTSPAVSNPCLHAISSLLEKNRKLRIGAAGFETFTENPFFRDIDFEALEQKRIEPVFVPSSEKTNFDATYDLEELLLEEAPLEARARKQKPRPELRQDATPQEIQTDRLHRYIETYFTPFNYTDLPVERSPVAPNTQDFAEQPSHTSTGEESQPVQDRNALRDPERVSAGIQKPSPKVSPVEKSMLSGPGTLEQVPETKPLEPVRSKKTKYFSASKSANSSGARTTSSTASTLQSPSGSPPFAAATIDRSALQSESSNLPPECFAGERGDDGSDALPKQTLMHAKTTEFDSALAVASPASQASSRTQRPRGPARSASLGGGIVLRSPSNVAPPTTAPGDEGRRNEKPTGMLGFLSRRKGRDRSPKAGKERERGVIGKEGARVVLKE